MEIVGVFSFKGCTGLREIVIPEGVRVLASKAFQFCSALKKVYLPSTLIDVDMRAFGKCESLEEVFYQGSEEQWEQIMISPSASDNQYLVQARRYCLGTQSTKTPEIRQKSLDRYEQIIRKVREVLDQGGDGGSRESGRKAVMLHCWFSRMDKQCSLTQASWSVESMWSPC